MTDDNTLPVTVAARSAIDLMLCVLGSLVLGMAVAGGGAIIRLIG